MSETKAPTLTLDPHRRQGAEYASNTHTVTVAEGHTREDIMQPVYWAHVSKMFRPYDEIKLRCDDGTFYARLLVLACDRLWAKVHVLEWHNLTTADVALTQAQTGRAEDYELRFLSQPRKFAVIRKADGGILHEGAPSKAAAQLWLDEHLKLTQAVTT